MLTSATKASIVKEYQLAANDTGSPEVQVALLTADIKALTEHMKRNKKDYHSRRGLLKKVETRRKLLKYLKKVAVERYKKLIQSLGLRH